MILRILFSLLLFVSGMAFMRRYKDSDDVCSFADAALTLVGIPAAAVRALFNRKPEAVGSGKPAGKTEEAAAA